MRSVVGRGAADRFHVWSAVKRRDGAENKRSSEKLESKTAEGQSDA